MARLDQRTRSVQIHDFAMNPRADVPRSQFNLSHGRKVPFNFANLVPILCEFVLPGDTWNCRIQTAARTAVPIVPVQDNWHLEFFSFFIPMRLVWDNAAKFFGEQANPGDSIAFTIPTVTSPAGGYSVGGLYDLFGLPTSGQVAGGATITHNVLPLRCYNLVYNEWFRDENLQNSVTVPKNDGPDSNANYNRLSRGKRFDYITQALPWPQKGNTAITLPIAGVATVNPLTANTAPTFRSTGPVGPVLNLTTTNASDLAEWNTNATATSAAVWGTPGLVADLSTATGPSLNAFRTAVAMQQYLEKDARGGTRYTEYVFTQFGVRTADARLNRPEFIGGGYAPITTTAIPQTSATGLTGGSTPAGSLAASGHVTGNAGFTYSATEHGYVLTLVSARADLTYGQGLRKMWSISTRYDIPVPLLANLGEQALLSKEVYCDGTAGDNDVFGYVPRFDEYRFIPSQIVGIYRTTAAGNIAYWHSSQHFSARPTLNSTFITEAADVTVQRNFAAGAATVGQQLLADFFFDIRCARALPLYGIPGLTRL